VIAESHISIHTFQKKNYAFIDLFSCKHFDYEFAQKYLIDVFESQKPTVNVLMRGYDFPRSGQPESRKYIEQAKNGLTKTI